MGEARPPSLLCVVACDRWASAGAPLRQVGLGWRPPSSPAIGACSSRSAPGRQLAALSAIQKTAARQIWASAPGSGSPTAVGSCASWVLRLAAVVWLGGAAGVRAAFGFGPATRPGGFGDGVAALPPRLRCCSEDLRLRGGAVQGGCQICWLWLVCGRKRWPCVVVARPSRQGCAGQRKCLSALAGCVEVIVCAATGESLAGAGGARGRRYPSWRRRRVHVHHLLPDRALRAKA